MQSRVWRLAFVVVLIVVVLLCALPMGVAAGKPIKVPYAQASFDYNDCGFTLSWKALEDKEYEKYWFDAQGNLVKYILTGTLKGTISRLGDDGSVVKSVYVNLSGPEHATLDHGTLYNLVFEGPAWWDFPFFGMATPPGLPDVGLYDGRLTFTEDLATGALTFVSVRGHATDLCALFSK
jgi:hypothetical protein